MNIPSENPPVTLARVWGVECGRGYVTVAFVLNAGRRGDHMRRKIKWRPVRRAR